MKHTRLVGMVFGVAASAMAGSALAQTPAQDPSAYEEIVVDFDDGTSESTVAEVAREAGVALVPNSMMAGEDGIYRGWVLRERAEATLRALSDDSHVEAAEENAEMRALFTPNDPMLGDQWGMRRVGATSGWDISCGRGVTVAVVDTGVACENHGEFTRLPDLAGTRCVAGWNFVNGTAHANDDQGHGTHVAGTIAQTTNNRLGTAGIAYCATIMPVKVLDGNGRGTLANVAEGIRWAADHGAQVINLSLGGGGRSKVMASAVEHARSRGTIVICAAGNNGRYVESPANEPGSVAVSAIDEGDQIASFSSRGPEVDVAAPGVRILQQTICDHGRNRCEQFAAWSGTSMAAPHVAGVAATIVALGVTDPDAVEAVLKASASRPANGSTDANLYGAGIVNVQSAAREVIIRHGLTRLFALLLLSLLLGSHIKRRGGELSYGAIVPAFFTGVGAFFLPLLVSHIVPGVDLAMRPLAEWDAVLAGAEWHRWLPLANAGVVVGLVGLGFGRKSLRSTVGGIALGVAAYLAATAWMGDTAGPFGTFALRGWTIANALVCLWIARIGIDSKNA